MVVAAGLFDLLFPFFGIIGLGFAFGRRARIPEAGLAWMQAFIVYLALPCLFFRLISEKPVGELANWTFVLGTTCATAAAFALAFATGALCGLRPSETVLGAVAGSYSNVGYMGPPLVVSLLGAEASAPVALIFVFDTIFLFSATPALMALAGLERRGALATAGDAARKVMTHPFVVATLVAVAASSLRWQPPEAIGTMVTWLSRAAAPCALFVLGVTAALRPAARVPREVPALVAIKLVLHPAMVWVLLSLLPGIEPVWTEAAIVMAALPPALNIFVLARQYEVGVERASSCILVGTLASILTLSTAILLFQTGALPVRLFGY